MENLVRYTTFLSIFVQLLTGVVGGYALTKVVPPEHAALQISLTIEMLVQAIELGFYVWLVYHFDVATMAATRYFDWIFTTPLMLVALLLYFKYEEYRTRGMDTTKVWRDFLRDDGIVIAKVVVSNALMILLGYLGEKGVVDKMFATISGFIAMAYAFYTMYVHAASNSAIGMRVFSFVAVVWSLYGVAYVFPDAPKNIALNGLDVVAKNIFGAYLSYKVLSV